MSGGGLNYLQHQEQPSRTDLQAALEALEAIIVNGHLPLAPLLDAHSRTMEILNGIPAADDPIRKVWAAIDRWIPGDTGELAVLEAVNAYATEKDRR